MIILILYHRLAGRTVAGVPRAYNEAASEAQGVYWKAFSAAEVQGVAISAWTRRCPLGVLSAYAVRALGHVLGEWDVYRLVQRALESLERVLGVVEETLRSPWRVFGALHALGLVRRVHHEAFLTPRELAWEEESGAAPRSPTWEAAAERLRSAAAAGGGAVLATALPGSRAEFLPRFLLRADRLGFLARLVVVPLEGASDACGRAARAYDRKHPSSSRPAGWSPCLPLLSRFPDRARYLCLHLALQLGAAILWFDFHAVWVRSPLPWLEAALAGRLGPPSYQDHAAGPGCAAGEAGGAPRCGEGTPPDAFLVDEFYQRHWKRNKKTQQIRHLNRSNHIQTST